MKSRSLPDKVQINYVAEVTDQGSVGCSAGAAMANSIAGQPDQEVLFVYSESHPIEDLNKKKS
jgi:hypothetical protein